MILCYVVFVIMDCFWACLNSLLLIAGVKDLSGPGWQQNLYRGVTYASVFFYTIAIYTSYKLYKLLQHQFNTTMGDGGAG
eukprot:CAMPEP_0167771334 /NCGR_PEP_ID=MMETSP0111_2-20121227/221_1 /TAXON_ID=91324 /ORGANISM="Lotharella globosa, Strain CCCM811" /LENGTH=79 /DNA_ID=CAMNT_0007660677 /DNA_START=347 /DNA_END=582 /DNA_ORIENTATION=-